MKWIGVVFSSLLLFSAMLLFVASAHAPGDKAWDRCHDQCIGLSARPEGVWRHHTGGKETITCHCVRDFEIDPDGTNTTEVTP